MAIKHINIILFVCGGVSTNKKYYILYGDNFLAQN